LPVDDDVGPDEGVSAQLAQKPVDVGGRPVGGVSDAARTLNIGRDELRRANQIDSIAPEVDENIEQLAQNSPKREGRAGRGGFGST